MIKRNLVPFDENIHAVFVQCDICRSIRLPHNILVDQNAGGILNPRFYCLECAKKPIDPSLYFDRKDDEDE